jgi:hypothetical protein
MVRQTVFVAGLALVLTLLCGAAALAQGPEPTAIPIRVGVVIQARGEPRTFCLDLPATGATGLDALNATGLDLNVMAGPLGAAVCRLDGLGCAFPAEPCFCRCQGATCSYWAYFFQGEGGAWQYSGLGAASRRLTTGMVEGWLWSESTSQTPTGQLPAISFEAICARGPTGPGGSAGSGSAPVFPPESAPQSPATIAFVVAAVAGGVLLWRRMRRRLQ